MANELTLSVNGAKQVVSATPETPLLFVLSQRTEINRSASRLRDGAVAGRAPCCSMAKKSVRASHDLLPLWASR